MPPGWPSSWGSRGIVVQPGPRLIEGSSIEIAHLRGGKRPAEGAQKFLLLFIANHGEPFDFNKVLVIKLDLIPKSHAFPAVKIKHLQEHPDLAMLFHKPVKCRLQSLEVVVDEFTVHRQFQNLAALFSVRCKDTRISCLREPATRSVPTSRTGDSVDPCDSAAIPAMCG